MGALLRTAASIVIATSASLVCGACSKFEAGDPIDAGARDAGGDVEVITADGGDGAAPVQPPARLTCAVPTFCEDFDVGTLDDVVTKWGGAVGKEHMSIVPLSSTSGLRCNGDTASQLIHGLTTSRGKTPTRVTLELVVQIESAPSGTYLFKLSTGTSAKPQQAGLAFAYDPSVGLKAFGVGPTATVVPNSTFGTKSPHLVQVQSSAEGTAVFVDGKGGLLADRPLPTPPDGTQGLFLVVGPEITGNFDVAYDDVKVLGE